MKVYYFASPYSSKNPIVKWWRYYRTVKWGRYLIYKGYTLLEPISMCHWHSTLFNLPSGYLFWQKRDREFIKRSDGVIILDIPGWRESVGVTDEIAYAKKLGKKIYVFKPKETEGRVRMVPLAIHEKRRAENE